MTKQQQKDLVALLKKLGKADSVPDRTKFGVCYHIEKILYITTVPDYVDIIRRWKHFSGETAYPVGGRLQYHRTNNLWTGTQGQLRRKFARYVAREIKKLNCE